MVRGLSCRTSRKDTGGATADATPLLPLPHNRPREINFGAARLPERKTSLRTACPPPRPPARPLQTAAAPSPPTPFPFEHAPQRLAAQGTTKTPRVAGRPGRKEHVAAWPIAGTKRNFCVFFEQALTRAGYVDAVPVDRSCARRGGGPGRNWRRSGCWPQTALAALPIAMCLLLAAVPAIAAGPVLLLRPPASPAPCRRTAGDATVAAPGMARLKPLSTPLEQTTASASPAWPLRPSGTARQ